MLINEICDEYHLDPTKILWATRTYDRKRVEFRAMNGNKFIIQDGKLKWVSYIPI